MKRRILPIIFLMLVVIGVISAQEVDFCFNLTPEDCAEIGAASAYTLENLTAYQAEFTLDFTLSGLAALGLGGDTELHITGTGIMLRDDMSTLVPTQFSLEMAGTFNTLDGTLNFMLTPDALYWQTDGSEWTGVLFEELSNIPELSMFELLLVNPPTSTGIPTFDNFSGVESLLDIPGFVDYQRLPDEAALSPYSFSLDFVPLFAAVEFQQLLDQILRFAGQLDASIESTALIAPLLLENSDLKINLTQYVGEDNFIHRLTLEVAGSVDLNPLLGTSGDNSMPPIMLNLDFEVALSEINQGQTISVPTEVYYLSVGELLE